MNHGVQLAFIPPGRPVENGFIEGFNGRLRNEFLNVEWFASLEEARQKLAAWRYHYNHQRPHSALSRSHSGCHCGAASKASKPALRSHTGG
jgi:putative transposase